MTSNNEIILYFVRHGESVGNVNRTILPQHEDLLTEKGKNQAEKLGEHFADVPFTRAYSSDYCRTFETASLILKHSKHLNATEIEKEVRLREQNGGIYEGKTFREALVDVFKAQVPIMDYKIPGGEQRQEVAQRFHDFLEGLLNELINSQNPNEKILIVSHAFCLRHGMNFLEESEKYQVANWSEECGRMMGNTSYIKIKFGGNRDGKWLLEFLETNAKPHLGEEGVKEAAIRNEVLNKFMKETGQEKILSGCVQT